jgi:hypothetical protein
MSISPRTRYPARPSLARFRHAQTRPLQPPNYTGTVGATRHALPFQNACSGLPVASTGVVAPIAAHLVALVQLTWLR